MRQCHKKLQPIVLLPYVTHSIVIKGKMFVLFHAFLNSRKARIGSIISKRLLTRNFFVMCLNLISVRRVVHVIMGLSRL